MWSLQYLIFWTSCISIVASERGNKYVPDEIPLYEHARQDYSFSYGVKDLITGDVKNQWEKKVGDVVHGHYTLLEPDGSLRIVHYTADDKNGFNAIVKHEGASYHPVTKIPTSHNQMSIEAKPRQTKPKSTQQKPQPHTQAQESIIVDPESETEAINAYLFIPSITNEHDYKQVTHYEFVPEKVEYMNHNQQPEKNKNHNPTYTTIVPRIKNNKAKTSQSGYDLLNPVTIDLTQTQYDFDQQHQLRQQLHHQQQDAVFIEPVIETGFKPLKNQQYSEQITIPNTFTTNKKPVISPGLQNFAGDGGDLQGGLLRGPVQFPKSKDRLIQATPAKKKNGFITYTKQISYFPDDY